MTLATRALLLALAAVSAGACHRARAAELPAASVALDVPPPPSRVLIPVTLADYEPPPPPEPEGPSAAPAKPAANSSRQGDRPATPSSPPPTVDTPAPVLQTTTNPNATEQRVIARLQSAERDLSRVPYSQLSPDGKAQYHWARSFMNDAREALKIKNYMHADYLADKAALLAGGLVKR